MLSVLRRRNFAFLWSGGVISQIGDWMLFVGLPIYVYTLTGSALATGITFMIETLPRILLGSLAGVFVDRWNRRSTMIVADLLRAIVLPLLLLVQSAQDVWIVYLVAIVMSVVGQFFTPASNALLPQIVDQEQILPANSLLSLNNNLTRLIGPALGGLLVTRFGFSSVILIDSVSFFLSAVLIALIAVRPLVPEAAGEAPAAPKGGVAAIWREWRSGMQLIRTNRIVSVIFLVVGTQMIGEGILQVLSVIFVRQSLHGGAQEFGLILTAQAVGGLAGGILIGRVGQKISPNLLIGLSGILNGLILLVIFNFPSVPLAIALFMLTGFPIVGFFVSLQALLQKNVPEQYLGRVFGAVGTTVAVMTLVGMIFASTLADYVGTIPMLDVVGLFNILAGMLGIVCLQSTIAEVPIVEAKPT